MAAFDNSLAHLLAEMEWIDLSIRALVARVRRQQTEDDQFRGLYLSEQRVDALLDAPLGMPSSLLADNGDTALTPRLAILRKQIDNRKQASLDAGIDLRLERLKQLFGLDEFDLRILLICLAIAPTHVTRSFMRTCRTMSRRRGRASTSCCLSPKRIHSGAWPRGRISIPMRR